MNSGQGVAASSSFSLHSPCTPPRLGLAPHTLPRSRLQALPALPFYPESYTPKLTFKWLHQIKMF